MPEKKTKVTEPIPKTVVTERVQPVTVTTAQPDSGLSIVSLILGILSVAGFGPFLGIPAVITGSIALKKKTGNHGMNLAGVITGAVGTVIGFLLFCLWLVVMIFAISQPETIPARQDPSGIERLNQYQGGRS